MGVRRIETTKLLCGMRDVGVPGNCADNILDILFPEQEDDEPAVDESVGLSRSLTKVGTKIVEDEMRS